MRKLLFTIIVFSFCYKQGHAQQTLVKTATDINFKTGLELIDRSKYSAAREFFERYRQQNQGDDKSIEAEYYVALSALHLFNPDAESLFESFVQKYPYHAKSVSAYFDLGTFYYNNKKYDKAIQYLQKVDFNLLTVEQQTDAKFRLGYSYFSQKEFEKAAPFFNEIKTSDHKYTYAASYYAAYVEYRNDMYDAALTDLKKAEQSEAYKPLVPLLKVNILYKKGAYDEMISYANDVLKSGDKIQGTEDISLLIGEASFKKRDYVKAAENFKKYFTDGKSKNSPDIQYRLAYSLYKTGDMEGAITNFRTLANAKDSLGQAAAYYLGVSYVAVDNKQFALTAFDLSRKSSQNLQLRQEALFNYAKICNELEKYSDAVASLKEFSKSFPKSAHNEELQELLSESLLKSSNYSEALAYIESLKSRSLRVNMAYQRVAFYKGVELFNNDKFEDAIAYFNKSLEHSFDKDVSVTATYWKAEAYSILKKYEDAIDSYAVVFQKAAPANEYFLKARYGIGYAYYNTKQFDKALPHFREYVEQLKNASSKQNYNDALLRLADLYYVTRQYSEALKYYDQSITSNPTDKDYAWFQKGIALGLTGKLTDAIASFEVVIKKYPASLYYDDAVFQKAELDLENSNYEGAVLGFTRIITAWPSSGFVPYAYLKRGVAYSNLHKNAEAAADYKYIMEKFPGHPVANDALLGLQESLAASGRSEDLNGILSKYKELNPQSDALVKIEFENAKSLYNDQKYEKAIEALKTYINTYPESPNNDEAGYLLAESYFRIKNYTEAMPQYEAISLEKASAYYNRALQRMGELQFSQQKYTEAKHNYLTLLAVAKNKKERSNAWMGLMESYFNLADYDSAAVFATEILNNGNASIDAENRALLYQGKIAFGRKEYDKATDYFLNTINNAKDENAAEAQYMIASIQQLQQKYKQSNETLYELNNTFPSYGSWVDKSFLLIAENFVSMNEIFQARATLNSMIEKSPNKETVDKARTRLAELEPKEKAEKETNE